MNEGSYSRLQNEISVTKILEKYFHPPVRMMEMYKGEKEDKIECEMKGDDIGEILRLAKDISLCEGEGKDDQRSPPTKSKLIEK